MNRIPYKLVTFDATNTLLKLTAPPGIKYAEVANMFGVKCNTAKLTEAFKPNYEKQCKEHPNFGKKSGLGWENWWKNVVVGTFKDAQCNAPPEKLDIIVTQIIDVYKTIDCWRPTEGAFGLLSYLLYRRIPVGVISNFDPRLHDILRNLKLKQYFRFIITSYESGSEKPDTKIFNDAMTKSGMITLRPEECLHIGDSVMSDYYAAINNRWKGILVRKDKNQFKELHPSVNPQDIFPTLYDLLKYMVTENKPRSIFAGPRTAEAHKSSV